MPSSLFCGTVAEFLERLGKEALPERVAEAFEREYGFEPGDSEFDSWSRSWPALAGLLEDARVPEAGLLLEYRLPLASRRVDCLVVGPRRAVLVEVKQWTSGQPGATTDCVHVYGQETLHPSAQASAYGDYLAACHSAFVDRRVELAECAYLHNLDDCMRSVFCSPRYEVLLRRAPVYARLTEPEFAALLRDRVGGGPGLDAAGEVERGTYRPDRTLLANAARAIEGEPVWRLIDGQLYALHVVLDAMRGGGERSVVIVTGGPGTGKSVLALHLVARAAREGAIVTHATGSKAFTTNMRGLVGRRNRRLESLFRYFNDFTRAPPRSIDLVVCDEAHRIRKTSSSRFHRSDTLQVDEILRAGRTCVFLLDERQSVRPMEVGSVALIEERARALGATVRRIDLDAQFRCAGSEGYLRWIEGLLGLGGSVSASGWRTEFDFAIAESPAAMEAELRARAAEGGSARLVAGFCWPWSDPVAGEPLPLDVAIGGWRRPWNRKPPELMRGGRGSAPPPHRHPYTLWATTHEGFDQIGCIYSAQGFEFDYVGVIWGGDLAWRDGWVARPDASHDSAAKRGLARDPAALAAQLRRTYRVLLTRGMRGCRVCCTDPATEAHIRAALRQ